jgi:tRNA-guanine family transglycosylase
MRLLHLQALHQSLFAPFGDVRRRIWQALNSIHNIRFLIKIMEGARKAIQEDRFGDYKDEVLAKYGDDRGF